MPTAVLADGRSLVFPDGTDPEVIQATVQRMLKPERRAPVAELGRDIARAPGLTARYLMEGVPQLADLAWNPIKDIAVNPLLGKAGIAPLPSIGGEGGSASRLADMLGLPKPETAGERVAGEASRQVAGVLSGAGLAKSGANLAEGVTKRVIDQFASNAGMQGIAAAGGGAAGQAAKEGGAGAGGQFAASLLGTVAAPLGAGKVNGAADALKAMLPSQRPNAQQIDAVLRLELGRNGVDWETLAQGVRQSLREDAGRFVVQGQPLNGPALARLAQYRAIDATPLLGDITQDARLVSMQRNLGKQQANMPSTFGGPDIAQTTNQNAQRVLDAIDGAATSSMDAGGTARGIMGAVQSKDARWAAIEKALYDRARASAGRDIPLARGAFVEDANRRLKDTNAAAFLPAELENWLNTIAKGEAPFTVDTIDAYKRVLSNATQGANGNARMAIRAVRDALDNVGLEPIKRDFGGGQLVTKEGAQFLQQQDELPDQAMRAFDRARGVARGHRQWEESAGFIDDALNGGNPEQFVRKHIIGAPVDDLQRMSSELAKTPDLRDAVRRQMVEYIMQRGNADPRYTIFASKGLQDGMKALDRRRMELFFKPEEISRLEAAVGVGRSMQAQPIGSAVNNSNSGALIAAKAADLAAKGTGLPFIGPMVASPLQGAALSMQARSLANPMMGIRGTAPETSLAEILGPSSISGGLLLLP